jgi:hypothetical protein
VLRPGPAPLLAPQETRLRHDRPTLAWASLGDRDALRASLVQAAGARRVATLRVLARTRPGSEPIEGGLAASVDVLPSALESALAALPPHDLLLLEGSAGIACLEPDVALAVVHDRPVTDWPADLRAMRGALDLVLMEPRPKVLAELVARLPT